MTNELRVVLDTNILISALWSKDGNPAKIIHLIPDRKITPYFCEEILCEYRVTLSRPNFHFHPSAVNELLDELAVCGKNITARKSDIPLPDESDRVFYDTANEADAILITGNIKHYPNEPFIMTPSDFFAMYSGYLGY